MNVCDLPAGDHSARVVAPVLEHQSDSRGAVTEISRGTQMKLPAKSSQPQRWRYQRLDLATAFRKAADVRGYPIMTSSRQELQQFRLRHGRRFNGRCRNLSLSWLTTNNARERKLGKATPEELETVSAALRAEQTCKQYCRPEHHRRQVRLDVRSERLAVHASDLKRSRHQPDLHGSTP